MFLSLAILNIMANSFHLLQRELKKMNCKYIVDIKTMESIKEKAIRKNKSPEEFSDLVRAAIFVPRKDSLDKYVRRLLHVFGRENCSVEYKNSGLYRGVVHVDVRLKTGLTVEIQITPRNLWSYKAELHKSYKGDGKYVGDFMGLGITSLLRAKSSKKEAK